MCEKTYKGYELKNVAESKRFNGIRIHIYDNRNGKYGWIELGKDCFESYSNKIVLLNALFSYAIDLLEKGGKSKDYEQIRFSSDFADGYFTGLADFNVTTGLSIPSWITKILDSEGLGGDNEDLDYWITPKIPDGGEDYRRALCEVYLSSKHLNVDLLSIGE